ncbi:MAG: tetratricopeptide repeat protein [Bacteroidota bacterium]
MRYLLCLLFYLLVWQLHGQHSIKIDSLNQMLEKDLSSSEKAYTLDELSYEWFSQNLDSSLQYGQKAYRAFSYLDDPKGLSQAATSVAVAYHYLSDWDSAEYYYSEALNIREENNQNAKVASSLNNLGVMFMDMEEYKKATDYYLRAMRTREQLDDSVSVAITKSNLGLIFKKQGIYDKALEYYLEAKQYFERLNRLNYLEVALLNLGAIYNTIEDFDKALVYNQQLLKLAKRRSSLRNLAKSYVNLANSFQGLDQLDSSLHYATKGLDFFESRNDSINISSSLLSIARYHLEKKDYQKAIFNALKMEKMNEVLDNKELAIENQLILAEAYAASGAYKQAYRRIRNALASKDSFLTKSLNATIANLTLKYEAEQKESEIAALKIANQESIISEQNSANQRNILLLVAGILVVGTVLLFLLLKTKSRANGIISKSLREKEVLLKEIHHRVKNNLQVISSLLSLQSRFIEDENAQALVNEGQNRVKSMALIHQKLYQKDNLTGVEVLDYIKNLSTTLQNAYGVNSEYVSVQYNVDELKLDVDTMIPIGLILNELISNAFKHAFPQGKRGELNISLVERSEKLLLTVKDDGVGSTKDAANSNSFGMRMIKSLSRKLEANVHFDFNNGTEASLTIANYKLYN